MSDKAVMVDDIFDWIGRMLDGLSASRLEEKFKEQNIPTFTSLKPLDKETVEGMQKDVYQAMAAKSEYTMRECRMYNKALDDVLKKCGKPTLDSIETPEETAEIDKEYEEGRVKSFDNPEKAIEFLRKQPTLDREKVAHIIHMFVNKATANQVDIFGIKEQSELAQAICDAVDKGELT